MNVLVTGGGGFLGSQIVRALAKRGDAVIIYDNYVTADAASIKDIKNSIKIVKGDISDLSRLLETLKVDKIKKIVHAGAIGSPAQVIEQAWMGVHVNIGGTISVLEAARLMDINRIIFISSEETYGVFQYEPADENHPLTPVSLYGVTKVAAEQILEQYNKLFGMSCISIRTSWVYGPGLPRRRPPRIFIEDALMGKPTKLACGADHKMDHTYIDDLVQGALLALDSKNPKYSVYNIATGKSYTLRDLVSLIKNILPQAKIEVGPGLLYYMGAPIKEGCEMPQKGALNIERAKQDLGYNPENDLETGLRKYVGWFKKSKGLNL